MSKRKFAVFDIDGTVSRNSLILQVIEQLVDDGALPESLRAEFDQKFTDYQHRAHVSAFREYQDFVFQSFESLMKQVSVADYERAVETVAAKSQPVVYTYTRQLLQKLKNEGYFLAALSGSEQRLVEAFCKAYDFDAVIAERYREDDGYFSGHIDKVFDKKDALVQKMVNDHDLTSSESYAVGDSLSDAAMLRVVENPIAFNPEDRLLNEAKKHGWSIVVERKNVVYMLTPNSNGNYELA